MTTDVGRQRLTARGGRSRPATDPGRDSGRVRLDPRTKLALIAAMAVAVVLAPGPAYEMILMAAACAFSAVLGRQATV